jgi:hypothetical protein
MGLGNLPALKPQPRQGRNLCRTICSEISQLRQERHRPSQNMPHLTELDLVWVWFYKDVAPTALEIFGGKRKIIYAKYKIKQRR